MYVIYCHSRFSLSRDTIIHALPRIDTSKTAIKEICPTFLKPVKCELTRYRTLTGMCNNLEHPSWGSARSAMVRYLPPEYADGMYIKNKIYCFYCNHFYTKGKKITWYLLLTFRNSKCFADYNGCWDKN